MQNPEIAFSPDWFSSPGQTICALLRQKQMSESDFAELGAFDRAEVQQLLLGWKKIDTELAQILVKTLGGSADFWLNRQSDYETWLARAASKLDSVEAEKFVAKFPIKEMRKLGFVPPNWDDKTALLQFFGVTNIDDWSSRYGNRSKVVAFRRSNFAAGSDASTQVWLRQAERKAALINCAAWNKHEFVSCLSELKALTRKKKPEIFFPRLVERCARAGVAVVFVRAPTGCRASGATMFLSERKAMIVLSFRHLTDDQFWFSFFHEAGHLVLHDMQALFLEDAESETTLEEKEADSFASEHLIPSAFRAELESLPARSLPIIKFAARIGISPGIVVGYMQHNRLIGFNQQNRLKRRFNWKQLMETI